MLMTDLAVRDLEARQEGMLASIRRALVSLFGRESNHNLPEEIAHHAANGLRTTAQARQPAKPALRVVQAKPEPTHAEATPEGRWARHPQLRSRQVETVDAGSTRAARLEAERGLILARGGKLVEAVEAFTTAARDPKIDLSTLPGFWDLPRNGMLAAVRAYERTDRLRDAAALEARIRHMLKPRALRPIPARQGRLSAIGD